MRATEWVYDSKSSATQQLLLFPTTSCVFQGPAAMWRKVNSYLFYEMFYLQLCCLGKCSLKNMLVEKGGLGKIKKSSDEGNKAVFFGSLSSLSSHCFGPLFSAKKL